MTRLANNKKAQFTPVNEHFLYEHNEVSEH